MRTLSLYFFACIFLYSCQSNNAKIKDEENLKHLLGVSNIEYKIVFELDELEQMNEGIYLASLMLTDESFRELIQNVQISKEVSLSPKYTASTWKNTPTKDVPFDIFSYNPTDEKTKELLVEIAGNLKDKDNFFFYTSEKVYTQNINLYVLDVGSKRIKIYQTYF